ncbi:hypothetical protein Aperf_G00000043957 [Anoplocephala perfoliata]
MRSLFAAIIIVSLLTAFTIANAYYQKKQFYPTVVLLTRHKPYFALIILQCFIILFIIAKIISYIFFGDIQRMEIDTVFTRIMYTSFDMCLLFTFFQEEISTKFLFLFSVIIFMKGFHWLLEGRVDLMERTPVIRTSFHIRIMSFMSILLMVDLFHIAFFYWGVDSQNVSSLAVGAEYYILFFELISIMMRYAIQVIDSMRGSQWDQKSLYLLYVDVIVGMLRVLFYLEFAPILWRHHPFPLFIIRPIYLNLRFLKKTIRNLVMSRRAIRLMNNVFHDVSAAEMASSTDAVCIICREEMMPAAAEGTLVIAPGTIKRLPCGHIFHTSCLQNWFQRQQTCPTCRMNILRPAGGDQAGNRAQRRAARAGQGQQPQQQQMGQSQTRRSGGSAQIRIDIQRCSGRSPEQSGTQPIHPSIPYFLPNMRFPGITSPNSEANIQQMFMGPPIIIPGEQIFPVTGAPMPNVPAGLAESESSEALELKLRAGVEARIEALRRIQTLLDASIIQMNTYLAVANTAPQDSSASLPQAHQLAAGDNQSMVVSAVEGDKIEDKNSSKSEERDSNLEKPKSETNEERNVDQLSILRQRRLDKLENVVKEEAKP